MGRAGRSPRLALLVDVPVRVHRPAPSAPRVTGGLRITETPLRAVRGQVVGPSDVPVPGVRVVAVGLDLATRTDAHGAFAFAGLPVAATRLTVAGKGLRGGADVPADAAQPVVLHCQYEEV
ncbi:carboxypeptidase-like regulatory domain-containing protein [Luedemannella flava]